MISLKTSDYGAVHHWADKIIDLEENFLHHWRYAASVYVRRYIHYAAEAYYTAYYSKAVAFQKIGDLENAMDNFRGALFTNGGCHASWYQLENLKQMEGLVDQDLKLYTLPDEDGFWWRPIDEEETKERRRNFHR